MSRTGKGPGGVSGPGTRPSRPPEPRGGEGTIRVLQVVLSLVPGGTERLVIDLVRRLPPAFRSFVCCLDEPGPWAEELRTAHVPVCALRRRPGLRPSLGRRIARLVRERDIRVMHCHQYSPFVYGCLAKILHPRTRLIFTEHGRLAGERPSRRRRLANRLLGRIPERSFAVCEDLRRHLIAEGFPPSRLEVLYNGIELGRVPSPADRARARRLLGVPPECFLLGTIARLDRVKSLETLLEAFAHARGALPQARLVLVGDGPERSRLQALVRARDLEGSVSFAGHREKARELLPAFDLYVNSSIYEGVSLTVVEAMLAAIPVVATRVGGNPEVVEDGRSGLLVPPRDPRALARAIEALALQPEKRRRFAFEGRRRACERFAFDRMLRSYARVYLGQEEG